MHDEPLSMHNPEQQEKTQAQTARNPTTNSKRNNQLSKQELTTTIIMLDLVAPRLRTSYADDTEPLRPIWVVVKIMVPFWGTLNNRCRIILGTQKGTILMNPLKDPPGRSPEIPSSTLNPSLKLHNSKSEALNPEP